MKAKSGFLLLLLAIAAGGLAFTAGLLKSSPSPEGAPAVAGPPARWVQGVGYVEPVSEVRRLSFKGNGVIGRCLVEVGQDVRRGDVLIWLSNGEEQAAVTV